MRRGPSKIISSLMLLAYLAGFVAYGFSSTALAHELDHAVNTVFAPADHDHTPHSEDAPDPLPMSDAEHELLHAMAHYQLIPGAMFGTCDGEPVRTTPLMVSTPVPQPAALDPPFRPPRSTFLS